MQSTDIEEIKAALWEQSHHSCTRVKWGSGTCDGGQKKQEGEPASSASSVGRLSSCGQCHH